MENKCFYWTEGKNWNSEKLNDFFQSHLVKEHNIEIFRLNKSALFVNKDFWKYI